MTFAAALEVWLRMQTTVSDASGGLVRQLKPRSVQTYRENGDALLIFFGDIPLGEIHDGHLREYCRRRAAQEGAWTRPCGQNRIRKEIDLMLRILRAARLWDDDLDFAYQPLPMVKTDERRALSGEQIDILIARMRQLPEQSEWVLYDSVAALHTCASTFERREAKLEDVNLAARTFRVGPRQSKNKYRNRTIPLENDEAVYAFDWLVRRARACGATKPGHYLFPKRLRRGTFDPTQPMTRWALVQQFEAFCDEPFCAALGMDDLRPYDLRHTAMSILAEAGTPITTIMAFGGQVSPEMQRHYTTVSLLAMRNQHRIAWSDLSLLGPLKKPPMRVVPQLVAESVA
jgi:integrase